ncbi:TPA: hypothetical protein REU56_002945, partial [Listeria monocytogenes]|nr:hypothetical protein [Listeria monocytogenes]
MNQEKKTEQTELDETDRIAQEVAHKIDKLAERIEQYRQHLQPEINYFIEQHNGWLSNIDSTGFNDPEMDPVLLGPGKLARIELW